MLDVVFRGGQLHLADVNVVAGTRQQGFENESLCASGLELAIAVDAYIAFAGFGAARGRIEKVLRISNRWGGVGVACGEGLGRVGAHQFGRIAGENVVVGKEIGPDNLTTNSDDDANCVFLTKLSQDLVARLHYRRSGLIDFFADNV